MAYYGAMRIAHIIFGSLVFIAFLITGQYMRADFPDKDAIDQELRLLMRSRHIYILFSALIHLAIGAYLRALSESRARLVQYLGSAVLFASSALLVWAFVSETYSFRHFSNLSRYGIYISLAGVILHLISGVSRRSG